MRRKRKKKENSTPKIKRSGSIKWCYLDRVTPQLRVNYKGEIEQGYVLEFYNSTTDKYWCVFASKEFYEEKEARRRKYSRGVLKRNSKEYIERGEAIKERARLNKEMQEKKRQKVAEKRAKITEEDRKKRADSYSKYICKKEGISSLKESKNYYRVRNSIRKYKTSKHNVDARERYYKNRKPLDISPDYSEIIADKQENGELVFNSKKAEIFVKQIKNQFTWKKTVINFTDSDGIERIAREAEDIIPYILNNKIDLSKGLYFSQYIHSNISRTNPAYSDNSDVGLYHEVRRYMRKRNCKVIFYVKHKDKKCVVLEYKKLNSFKNIIDWNRDVQVISKTPERMKTSKWNIERGGAWKNLKKLVSPEHAQKYRLQKYFINPLKNAGVVKSFVDLAVLEYGDRAAHGAINRFRKFNYNKCQSVLKGQSIKLILKKFPDLILNKTKTLEEFYGLLEDSLRESRFQHRLTCVVQSFISSIYENILKNTKIYEKLKPRKDDVLTHLKNIVTTNFNNNHNYIKSDKPTKQNSFSEVTFYKNISELKERARNIRNGGSKSVYEKYMTDRRLWHTYEKEVCEA